MDESIDTLKTQLLQLQQLHDSGALPTPEYETSKAALERRVLAFVMSGAGEVSPRPPLLAPGPVTSVPAAGKPSRALLMTLGVFVLVVALGGYRLTGSPSLAGIGAPPPVAAEGTQEGGGPSHSVTAEQIAEMTERLAARLKEQPQDPQGWAMLGRSYAVLGRNDDAVKAYETAVKQQGDDAVLIADYADALAVKNNRTLAGEPMKWVRRALELDPKNVKALALAGTEAFDRKDFAGAVKYWEDLLRFGPTDGGFIAQVKASVAEARQLGGMPAAAVTAMPAPAPAAPKPVASSANATVAGTVTLSPALASKAGPDDTVFIFARAAEGSRMPLAVLRKRVRDLPTPFTLDDSLAMSPAAKLSGAPRVIVGARISKSGNAMPAPGDLTGQVGPVELGSAGLAIEIREQVKP